MKYIKVHLLEHGTFIQEMDKADEIITEFIEGEVGDKWEIEIIEMEPDEYAMLEEFAGH